MARTKNASYSQPQEGQRRKDPMTVSGRKRRQEAREAGAGPSTVRGRGTGRARGRGRGRRAQEDEHPAIEEEQPVVEENCPADESEESGFSDGVVEEQPEEQPEQLPEQQPEQLPEQQPEQVTEQQPTAPHVPRPTFPYGGGPEDRSVLPTYGSHVARDVWDGKERGPIRIVSKGLPQLFDLPPQVKELVEGTKLLPLADIGFKTTSKGLINGFVERWHSDTSSFHLPIGEMSITLDDVSALTHLPIEAMLVEMLGASQEEAAEMMAKNGVYVSLVFLRDTLYPRAVAEGEWAFAARAFIMFMLGWGPFVDKSGNRIKLGWLGALADLQTAGDYSWGAMALAHLYDQLRDAEKSKTRQLGGWLALLQVRIKDIFVF